VLTPGPRLGVDIEAQQYAGAIAQVADDLAYRLGRPPDQSGCCENVVAGGESWLLGYVDHLHLESHWQALLTQCLEIADGPLRVPRAGCDIEAELIDHYMTI
jgi:hypothetical protein